MKNTPIFSFILGLILTSITPLLHSSDFENTSELYSSLFEDSKTNEALLTLFLTQMPKGGDLHHHYSGTIYAETYLEWVKGNQWFIDSCTLKIIKQPKKKPTKGCQALTVDQLMANNALYRKLLKLWSDKDFSNHHHEQSAPDRNFFNSFSYFYEAARENIDLGLQIIKKRALAENVSYIETMLDQVVEYELTPFDLKEYTAYNLRLRSAESQNEVDSILDELSNKLNNSEDFSKEITSYISKLNTYHQEIDDDQFTMRYQAYTLRVLDPVFVFKDLLAAYTVSNKSPLVVGVNILGPENNATALKDYTLHMRMFHYLSAKYPDVHKSLHSGELTLGMVRPKDLQFHIKQAREIAGADRIGHGIDLMYEKDAPSLIQDLKKNAAIEINLTSNEFILGVKDQAHPYLIYSKFGVPIVISSDDTGVSRNNLTNEYLLLATRYQPDYKQLKQYVYNSIEHSFMDEADKLRVKSQLDALFVDFEREMSTLYKSQLH